MLSKEFIIVERKAKTSSLCSLSCRKISKISQKIQDQHCKRHRMKDIEDIKKHNNKVDSIKNRQL